MESQIANIAFQSGSNNKWDVARSSKRSNADDERNKAITDVCDLSWKGSAKCQCTFSLKFTLIANLYATSALLEF